MAPALFAHVDSAVVAAVVAAVTAVITTVLTVLIAPRLDLGLQTTLLRRKADTEHEFERRRTLRRQIGRYHGRMLSATDAFSDRLENMTRHHPHGWLDVGGGKHGPWRDTYYYRSTVTRFLQLMALVYEFEHQAIFVDSRFAEPADTRFVIYARMMRFVVTDVRLFRGTTYAVGRQTDHFFTDDLRRICSSLTAGGHQVGLDRLDELLRSDRRRLRPVMRYFDGISPETLRWDRLFALQMVLLAFMNDFGHRFQHADDAAFTQAANQIANLTVVQNLRVWLLHIGGAELASSPTIVRALDARAGTPGPQAPPMAPPRRPLWVPPVRSRGTP